MKWRKKIDLDIVLEIVLTEESGIESEIGVKPEMESKTEELF
jgi:hypothetical protein